MLALLSGTIVGAALLLAGCGGSSHSSATTGSAAAPTRTSGGRIIDINGPLSDPTFPPMKQGADAAAKALGINYQYSAAANELNVAADYTALIHEAITEHPAAMVIGDFAPALFDPLIKQVVAAGIPVVVVNSGLTSWQADGAIGYVGLSPQLDGQAAAAEAIKQGVHHMLCVDNVPQNILILDFCKELQRQMTAAGRTFVQLNIPAADNTNPAAQTQDIRGILASHPDIDGIQTYAAQTAVDAVAAVKAIGKSGKILIGAAGGLSQANLLDIQSGSMGWVIDPQIYLQGYYSLMIAAQYARYGMRPPEAVLMGGVVIDKSNVGKALAVQAEYPGLRGSS